MTKTTNYKGVSYSREHGKWRSFFTHQKIRFDCGYHDTEILAVKARDRKVMALGLPHKLLQIFKPTSDATKNP